MAAAPMTDLPSATAMAIEIAGMHREADTLYALFPGDAPKSREVSDRIDEIENILCDKTDQIVDSPVGSFTDALSVLMAANSVFNADLYNLESDLNLLVPCALAIQRAIDFLAAYMGTDLGDLGSAHFSASDRKLWEEGRGIRTSWWLEKALRRGFAFNLRSDGTIVICAPEEGNNGDLISEMAALDRQHLDNEIRGTIASQRDPEGCNGELLTGKEWWLRLTSESGPRSVRNDLLLAEGQVKRKPGEQLPQRNAASITACAAPAAPSPDARIIALCKQSEASWNEYWGLNDQHDALPASERGAFDNEVITPFYDRVHTAYDQIVSGPMPQTPDGVRAAALAAILEACHDRPQGSYVIDTGDVGLELAWKLIGHLAGVEVRSPSGAAS